MLIEHFEILSNDNCQVSDAIYIDEFCVCMKIYKCSQLNLKWLMERTKIDDLNAIDNDKEEIPNM